VRLSPPACRHPQSCPLGGAKSDGKVDKDWMEDVEDVLRQVR
jgi:hypothetical protein